MLEVTQSAIVFHIYLCPKIVTVSLRPCNTAKNATVGQGVPRDFKSWSMQGALSLLPFWLSLSLKAETPFCVLFYVSFWPLEGVVSGRFLDSQK